MYAYGKSERRRYARDTRTSRASRHSGRRLIIGWSVVGGDITRRAPVARPRAQLHPPMDPL